jgi:GNAT superfamily N-acetyltransferase
LYRHNPHGPALAWIAEDDEKGHAIGVASAFPRRVYVTRRAEPAWVLGDFCIRDDCRSLGVAVKLQRACLTAVRASGARLCFDFPNPGMMAVYGRLGIGPWSEMIRLAKPLRLDRHFRVVVRHPEIARALGVTIARLCGLGRGRRGRRPVTVTFTTGRCGDEFSELGQRVGASLGICVERSAAYINWRYVDHPVLRCERAEARREGRLVAYAIFTQSGEDGALIDIFGEADGEAVKELVEATSDHLRTRGTVVMSAPMLVSHPWRPWLQHQGFVPREAKPMVVCAPAPGVSREARWCFMDGDRDS